MIICHITSVHPRSDTRIFFKMCKFSSQFNKVYLVCADGKGNFIDDNIYIYDVGKPKNLINRIWEKCNQIFKVSLTINANIYHIHDPELIRIGLKLKKKGKKVIFDSHEDIPLQILSKNYLPKYSRHLISALFFIYQRILLRKFDGIIASTTKIKRKLSKINSKIEIIYNYPIISENISPLLIEKNFNKNEINEICYVGEITENRGLIQVIRALCLTKNKIKLNLLGNFIEKNFKKKLMAEPGWRFVEYFGYIEFDKIKNFLKKTKVGIVPLLPTHAYQGSLPVKMYEYMEYGLPIIVSDFLFKENIKLDCGLPINPFKPISIADALDYLLDNPDMLLRMSKNCRAEIIRQHNWQQEFKKLILFYESIN